MGDDWVILVLMVQGVILTASFLLLWLTVRATLRAKRYARQAHYSATQRLYRNELYGKSGKMLHYEEKETRRRRKQHRPEHAAKRS